MSGHGSDKAVTSGLSSSMQVAEVSWPCSFSHVTPKVGTRGFRALMRSQGVGMRSWGWPGSLGAGRRCTVRTRSPQVTQEAGGSVWIKWRCWVVSTKSPRWKQWWESCPGHSAQWWESCPGHSAQSPPEKDRGGVLATWSWRRPSPCSANTWLVKESRDVFNATCRLRAALMTETRCLWWLVRSRRYY